jgi:hypothetical protein
VLITLDGCGDIISSAFHALRTSSSTDNLVNRRIDHRLFTVALVVTATVLDPAFVVSY